jgi:hypothetical protein
MMLLSNKKYLMGADETLIANEYPNTTSQVKDRLLSD